MDKFKGVSLNSCFTFSFQSRTSFSASASFYPAYFSYPFLKPYPFPSIKTYPSFATSLSSFQTSSPSNPWALGISFIMSGSPHPPPRNSNLRLPLQVVDHRLGDERHHVADHG